MGIHQHTHDAKRVGLRPNLGPMPTPAIGLRNRRRNRGLMRRVGSLPRPIRMLRQRATQWHPLHATVYLQAGCTREGVDAA
jgi:hypothetical protein